MKSLSRNDRLFALAGLVLAVACAVIWAVSPEMFSAFLSGSGVALAMPMIMKEVIVGTGATNENLISGSAFEFARGRGVVSMGISGAAAGLVANLQAGADIIAEAFAVPVLTRYPIVPDEMYFTDVVEQGDRIVQRVQNPTAGAIVARSVTQLSFNG